MEFWSRCSRCRCPLEIMEHLEERAVISLRLKDDSYDAWLCDNCAGEIIKNPESLFVGALQAVLHEKNLA